jgi:hypothetical protein
MLDFWFQDSLVWNEMKNIFFLALIVSSIALTLPGSVVAVSTCPTTFMSLCKPVGEDSTFISSVISLLLFIAVVLALIFLLYGGIRWITSGGDKAKLDAARTTITGAVVGLILTFLAFFIINIIGFLFGIQNPLNIPIPKLV